MDSLLLAALLGNNQCLLSSILITMALKEASKDTKQVKPFTSKSFYLDLIGFNETKSLSEDILLLGGTLEPFLSKDVSCVITNRPQQRRIQGNCSNVNTVNSPRRTSVTPDPNEKNTPAKANPTKETTKPQVVIRGKEILKKAAKVGTGNCNVLDNAEKWGIKILNLTDVQDTIKKYKSKLSWKHQVMLKNAVSISLRVKKLNNPHIKIEAVNRQSRPIYMEFSSWPLSIFSSDKYIIKNSAKSKKKSTEKKIATANAITAAKSQKRFCEICRLPFHEMKSHLQSDQHRKSVNENEKFAVFDALISERYNLEWYLAGQNSQNLSFNESIDVDMLSPSLDKSIIEDTARFQEKDANISPVVVPNNPENKVKSIQCFFVGAPEKKRRFDFSEDNFRNKKRRTSRDMLTDKEIVNELLDEMCLTVSLFNSGMQAVVVL